MGLRSLCMADLKPFQRILRLKNILGKILALRFHNVSSLLDFLAGNSLNECALAHASFANNKHNIFSFNLLQDRGASFKAGLEYIHIELMKNPFLFRSSHRFIVAAFGKGIVGSERQNLVVFHLLPIFGHGGMIQGRDIVERRASRASFAHSRSQVVQPTAACLQRWRAVTTQHLGSCVQHLHIAGLDLHGFLRIIFGVHVDSFSLLKTENPKQ
mmetsp:Transcript_4124/g.11903  ORF Transcript_4124/g.11903 Transcript_4124/m.11903 type:complete len:214 (-) Transcript_4124:492-1133(-)